MMVRGCDVSCLHLWNRSFSGEGVREKVLVKAKKLYSWQLDAIKERIKICKAAARIYYLERKLKQLRSPLHSLLVLRKTPAASDDLPALLAKAHEVYGVDTSALSDVRKDPSAALDALVQLLDRTVQEVDRMEA